MEKLPNNYQKEFVRQWLIENGFQGKDGQEIPHMSEEYVNSVSDRYIGFLRTYFRREICQSLDISNVSERLEKNILDYLS